MKIKVALLSLFSIALFNGCEDSSTNTDSEPLEATTVTDLDATGTSYVFYDFKTGDIVANTDSATTNWDIGIKGATIIVNSGVSGLGTAAAQIVDGLFDEYDEAPQSGYVSDTAEAKAITGNGGWYNYTGSAETGPQHAILPIPGKILVFKNTDGTYTKMQIISYYRGNPDTTTEAFINRDTRPDARVYTFRFITQPNGSRLF
ncbi:hypothetical protein EP331_10010 [bacterium]|nr:MAG: hypothetical protein EP331_10010 [bacterium]